MFALGARVLSGSLIGCSLALALSGCVVAFDASAIPDGTAGDSRSDLGFAERSADLGASADGDRDGPADLSPADAGADQPTPRDQAPPVDQAPPPDRAPPPDLGPPADQAPPIQVEVDIDALMLAGATGSAWQWSDQAPLGNTVTLTASGDHIGVFSCALTPCHDTYDAPPTSIVIAAAASGGRASVTFSFAKPVSGVSFRFRYLSTNGSADERLNTFRVDGSPVTPTLADAVSSELTGTGSSAEVRNPTQNEGNGRGKIVLPGTLSAFSFVLESYGTWHGGGTQINEIRYTTLP